MVPVRSPNEVSSRHVHVHSPAWIPLGRCQTPLRQGSDEKERQRLGDRHRHRIATDSVATFYSAARLRRGSHLLRRVATYWTGVDRKQETPRSEQNGPPRLTRPATSCFARYSGLVIPHDWGVTSPDFYAKGDGLTLLRHDRFPTPVWRTDFTSPLPANYGSFFTASYRTDNGAKPA
jgi:hypothetical protein